MRNKDYVQLSVFLLWFGLGPLGAWAAEGMAPHKSAETFDQGDNQGVEDGSEGASKVVTI